VTNLPDTIACSLCDDNEILIRINKSGMTASCTSCGKKRGPAPNMNSLIAAWYDLIGAETACSDLDSEIGAILKAVESETVDWKAHLAKRLDPAVAKRAAAILHNNGLIDVSFHMDGQELDAGQAAKAKAAGKAVVILLCRKRMR
jgi:hypothetical protein